MSNITVDELVGALQMLQTRKAGQPLAGSAIYKHSTPTGTPSTPYYTGPGGLFGVAQLPEQDVFSTRVQPMGILSRLPWRPTMKANPLFPYLTGFQSYSGSNPTNVCDDTQKPGAGKSCYQTAALGRYPLQTREMEVNRAGLKIDRGEIIWGARFVNDPLANAIGAAMFPGLPASASLVNGAEMLARMIEIGVYYQQILTQQVYVGNPANNTAGNGYKEFPGLDILIGTNKVDAITGTDCPSLDSLVRNFNYAKVTDQAADIVNEITYIARFLKSNAKRMNYEPATWAIVMREELFYEITAVWPCSYLTYRCAFRTADGTVVQNVSAADQIAMRDAMRAGRYLLIDGAQWEVILDDGITEEDEGDAAGIDGGCFASDIYFVNTTVKGGFETTFMEYLDYRGERGALDNARDGHYTDEFWSDDGRFLWAKLPNKMWCVMLGVKIEPRIIHYTPFLSARLTNVQYCPLIHTRQPFNSDNYFVDGGVSTSRAAPSLYSDWNLPN